MTHVLAVGGSTIFLVFLIVMVAVLAYTAFSRSGQSDISQHPVDGRTRRSAGRGTPGPALERTVTRALARPRRRHVRRRSSSALMVLALIGGAAGCGGDDEPVRAAQAAPGAADLQARVEVRAGRDDLWRRAATVAPGEEVAVRLSLANNGGRQAKSLFGGIVLPPGLTYVRGSAAEYKVPPPEGTGAPIDGGRLVGARFPIRPLPAGDVTSYRFQARVAPGVRGTRRVRGRVTGQADRASAVATIRVQ